MLNCKIEVELLYQLLSHIKFEASKVNLDSYLESIAKQIEDETKREAYMSLVITYLKKDIPDNNIVKDLSYNKVKQTVDVFSDKVNYRLKDTLVQHKSFVLKKLQRIVNISETERKDIIILVKETNSKRLLSEFLDYFEDISLNIRKELVAYKQLQQEVISSKNVAEIKDKITDLENWSKQQDIPLSVNETQMLEEILNSWKALLADDSLLTKNNISATKSIEFEDELYKLQEIKTYLTEQGVISQITYIWSENKESNKLTADNISQQKVKGLIVEINNQKEITKYKLSVDENNSIIKIPVKFKLQTKINTLPIDNIVYTPHKLPTINDNLKDISYTEKEIISALNDLYYVYRQNTKELDNFITKTFEDNSTNSLYKIVALRDKLFGKISVKSANKDYTFITDENRLIILKKNVPILLLGKPIKVSESVYQSIKNEIGTNLTTNSLSVKYPYIHNNIDKLSAIELIEESQELIEQLKEVINNSQLSDFELTTNNLLNTQQVKPLLLELLERYSIVVNDKILTVENIETFNTTDSKSIVAILVDEEIEDELQKEEVEGEEQTYKLNLQVEESPIADSHRYYVNESENLNFELNYNIDELNLGIRYTEKHHQQYKDGMIHKLSNNLKDTEVQLFMPDLEDIVLYDTDDEYKSALKLEVENYNKADTNVERFKLFQNILQNRINYLLKKNKYKRIELLSKYKYSEIKNYYPDLTEEMFLSNMLSEMLVPLTFIDSINNRIYGTVHTYTYIVNEDRVVKNDMIQEVLKTTKALRSNESRNYTTKYTLITYNKKNGLPSNLGYRLLFPNKTKRTVSESFGSDVIILGMRYENGVFKVNGEFFDNSTQYDENITELINSLKNVFASKSVMNTPTYYYTFIKVNTLNANGRFTYIPVYVYSPAYNEIPNSLLSIFPEHRNSIESNKAEHLANIPKLFRLKRVTNVNKHMFEKNVDDIIYSYYSNEKKHTFKIHKYNKEKDIDEVFTVTVKNGVVTSQGNSLKVLKAVLKHKTIYVNVNKNLTEYYPQIFRTSVNGKNKFNDVRLVYINPVYLAKENKLVTTEEYLPEKEKIVEEVIADFKTLKDKVIEESQKIELDKPVDTTEIFKNYVNIFPNIPKTLTEKEIETLTDLFKLYEENIDEEIESEINNFIKQINTESSKCN